MAGRIARSTDHLYCFIPSESIDIVVLATYLKVFIDGAATIKPSRHPRDPEILGYVVGASKTLGREALEDLISDTRAWNQEQLTDDFQNGPYDYKDSDTWFDRQEKGVTLPRREKPRSLAHRTRQESKGTDQRTFQTQPSSIFSKNDHPADEVSSNEAFNTTRTSIPLSQSTRSPNDLVPNDKPALSGLHVHVPQGLTQKQLVKEPTSASSVPSPLANNDSEANTASTNEEGSSNALPAEDPFVIGKRSRRSSHGSDTSVSSFMTVHSVDTELAREFRKDFVPVRVSKPDVIGKVRKKAPSFSSLAFIDNGSAANFISQKFCSKILATLMPLRDQSIGYQGPSGEELEVIGQTTLQLCWQCNEREDGAKINFRVVVGLTFEIIITFEMAKTISMDLAAGPHPEKITSNVVAPISSASLPFRTTQQKIDDQKLRQQKLEQNKKKETERQQKTKDNAYDYH